ncbi:MAG: hypothetical protein KME32_28885 [Mojavia pulchra JT2-VF2]|jgi:hypothetical protein|uniref:Uncharacterized protein n=1 Tax=Mojavia pulchra JT2-VF2 TaxID=287848 RepID=A0A951Q323_9NOST|nr:hypothetical protein [Mojavia pulchra JT2-VF2]
MAIALDQFYSPLPESVAHHRKPYFGIITVRNLFHPHPYQTREDLVE